MKDGKDEMKPMMTKKSTDPVKKTPAKRLTKGSPEAAARMKALRDMRSKK